MHRRSPRVVTALGLVLSIWASAISAFAQQPQQPQPQKTTQQTATQGQQKTGQQKAPAQTARPLGTNEDPTKIGKRNINKGIVAKLSASLEKEVAMGRQVAVEIERQVKLVDDPVITEYVNRVGQNIVLHSDAKVPFTIKVIDSDEVNAFALPGGFFYVNRGLILAADNEAELAGVMAHEIAHVAARHEVERQAKMMMLDYGLLAGMILTGGVAGTVIQNAAGLGEALAFFKFTRGAEEEADKLGVQYLYASGYDPNAMATMFEKILALNKRKPGKIAKLFTTHPQAPDRRAASIALVARFPEREEYVVSTSEFQRVKGRLLRLSNARATTAGDIAGDDNGAPGRPTLKRRQPVPDDATTTTPNGDGAPSDSKPAGPPKLKRNTGSDQSTTPPSQPGSNP